MTDNDSLARITALAGVVLVLSAFAGGGYTYGLLSDQEDGSVSIEAAANFATETTTTPANTDTTIRADMTETQGSGGSTEAADDGGGGEDAAATTGVDASTAGNDDDTTLDETTTDETESTSTTTDDSSGTAAANDASVDLLVGGGPSDADLSDSGPSGPDPSDADLSDSGPSGPDPSDAGSDAGGWVGTSAAREATGTPFTDRGVDVHE